MAATISNKILRVLYIIGAVALIIGAIDPLEGSVVILAGGALLALTTYLSRTKHWKAFLLAFGLIVFGVFFLFYFSSLGGFGGDSELSWWGTLILFYPAGWILAIVKLITRYIEQAHGKKPQAV